MEFRDVPTGRCFVAVNSVDGLVASEYVYRKIAPLTLADGTFGPVNAQYLASVAGRRATSYTQFREYDYVLLIEEEAPDVPNHGPCGHCGEDVRHAFPWWTGRPDKPGSKPLHEACARKVLLS